MRLLFNSFTATAALAISSAALAFAASRRLPAGLDKNRKTSIIAVILTAGFILAVIYHYVLGAYFGAGYPWNTFLFAPRQAFGDFLYPAYISRNLNPYFENYFIHSNYYPLLNLVFYVFSLLPSRPAIFIYTAAFVLLFARYVAKETGPASGPAYYMNLTAIAAFSYPFLYVIDRGNSEGFVFIALAFFLDCFKKRRFGAAAVFLSGAIAAKAYPALFLLLFVAEKQYRYAAAALALAAAATLAALIPLQHGFLVNLLYVMKGFDISATSFYYDSTPVLQGSLSLFAFCKLALLESGAIAYVDMKQFLEVYFIAAALLCAGAALFVVYIEKSLWKRTALIVLCVILLPHISGYYKLLHLFLPMMLFINADERRGSDFFYAALLALPLIPKNYYYFQTVVSDSGVKDIGPQTAANVALLLILGAAIIKEGVCAFRHETIKN